MLTDPTSSSPAKILSISRKASILCVDGCEDLLDCCGSILRRHNFAVRTTLRAQDAIACFREQGPDLVLTEWHMPGMRGDQLAQILKCLNPGSKLVLFSGSAVPVESLVHFDAYVPKEQVASLLQVMDELLAERSPLLPAVLINAPESLPTACM